jgi:hypothetical protein
MDELFGKSANHVSISRTTIAPDNHRQAPCALEQPGCKDDKIRAVQVEAHD